MTAAGTFRIRVEVTVEQVEGGAFMATADGVPMVVVDSTLDGVDRGVAELLHVAETELASMPPDEFVQFALRQNLRFEYIPALARHTNGHGGKPAGTKIKLERVLSIHEHAQRT